jgi:hypothetical protein
MVELCGIVGHHVVIYFESRWYSYLTTLDYGRKRERLKLRDVLLPGNASWIHIYANFTSPKLGELAL